MKNAETQRGGGRRDADASTAGREADESRFVALEILAPMVVFFRQQSEFVPECGFKWRRVPLFQSWNGDAFSRPVGPLWLILIGFDESAAEWGCFFPARWAELLPFCAFGAPAALREAFPEDAGPSRK